MTPREKYKYALRLTSVASTGLDFVRSSLERLMPDRSDFAYLRSFYLLLSYNSELLLKSRVIMLKSFNNKEEILGKDGILQKLKHDLVKVKKELTQDDLIRIGIKKFYKGDGGYFIVTIDNREIFIEDFTKIRYDFLDDIMRKIDDTESKRIRECLEVLDMILQKVKVENASSII